MDKDTNVGFQVVSEIKVKVYFSRPKIYLIILYSYLILLNFYLFVTYYYTHILLSLYFTLLHFTTSLYLNKRNFKYNLSGHFPVANWHTVNIIKTLLPKIHN